MAEVENKKRQHCVVQAGTKAHWQCISMCGIFISTGFIYSWRSGQQQREIYLHGTGWTPALAPSDRHPWPPGGCVPPTSWVGDILSFGTCLCRWAGSYRDTSRTSSPWEGSWWAAMKTNTNRRRLCTRFPFSLPHRKTDGCEIHPKSRLMSPSNPPPPSTSLWLTQSSWTIAAFCMVHFLSWVSHIDAVHWITEVNLLIYELSDVHRLHSVPF